MIYVEFRCLMVLMLLHFKCTLKLKVIDQHLLLLKCIDSAASGNENKKNIKTALTKADE